VEQSAEKEGRIPVLVELMHFVHLAQLNERVPALVSQWTYNLAVVC